MWFDQSLSTSNSHTSYIEAAATHHGVPLRKNWQLSVAAVIKELGTTPLIFIQQNPARTCDLHIQVWTALFGAAKTAKVVSLIKTVHFKMSLPPVSETCRYMFLPTLRISTPLENPPSLMSVTPGGLSLLMPEASLMPQGTASRKTRYIWRRATSWLDAILDTLHLERSNQLIGCIITQATFGEEQLIDWIHSSGQAFFLQLPWCRTGQLYGKLTTMERSNQ